MQTKRFIWALIEFTNGDKKWYCISRILRESLLIEKENNKFWKKQMIGNYITLSTSEYNNGRASLTVGKIIKLNILSHGTKGWNWTRNQFVTPEHLLNFKDAYNYLKHDYHWYNRFSIWVALKYWHNELLQTKIRKSKRKIRQKIWQINRFRIKSSKILNK